VVGVADRGFCRGGDDLLRVLLWGECRPRSGPESARYRGLLQRLRSGSYFPDSSYRLGCLISVRATAPRGRSGAPADQMVRLRRSSNGWRRRACVHDPQLYRHASLVRAGRLCASHCHHTSDPCLHRDRHTTVPSLRHRPHHQPHPRLRCALCHARATLLQRCDTNPDCFPFHHRSGTPAATRYRCLHPDDRRSVRSAAPSHAGVHRPAVLPKKVRCRQNARTVLLEAAG
jgi:hypothetical protein